MEELDESVYHGMHILFNTVITINQYRANYRQYDTKRKYTKRYIERVNDKYFTLRENYIN
jgi:hypothetical protein